MIKANKNKPAKTHCPVVNMLKSFLQMYNRTPLFLANFRSQIYRKMKKQLDAVKLFHDSFGVGSSEIPKGTLGDAVNLLRYNLMKEENEEYFEAVQNNDLTEIADALGDMLYILCGTIIEHGLQYKIEEVFDEIQRSNMSKLGADGKPMYREDGKVMKGPNYSKPNFEEILK